MNPTDRPGVLSPGKQRQLQDDNRWPSDPVSAGQHKAKTRLSFFSQGIALWLQNDGRCAVVLSTARHLFSCQRTGPGHEQIRTGCPWEAKLILGEWKAKSK